MSEKKEDNPNSFITSKLCEAYRETQDEKLKSLRDQIVIAVSIIVTLMTLVLATLQIVLGR